MVVVFRRNMSAYIYIKKAFTLVVPNVEMWVRKSLLLQDKVECGRLPVERHGVQSPVSAA